MFSTLVSSFSQQLPCRYVGAKPRASRSFINKLFTRCIIHCFVAESGLIDRSSTAVHSVLFFFKGIYKLSFVIFFFWERKGKKKTSSNVCHIYVSLRFDSVKMVFNYSLLAITSKILLIMILGARETERRASAEGASEYILRKSILMVRSIHESVCSP